MFVATPFVELIALFVIAGLYALPVTYHIPTPYVVGPLECTNSYDSVTRPLKLSGTIERNRNDSMRAVLEKGGCCTRGASTWDL